MLRAVILLGLAIAHSGEANVEIVHVDVNVAAPVVTLPATYLGFTLDWWPPQKSIFGTSSVLHIDFNNVRLRSLARSLGPATFRVGGSLDNVVQYQVGRMDAAYCNRTVMWENEGWNLCLNMTRWGQLAEFAANALAPGSAFVFGLQLDLGPQSSGPWNGTNVLDFLAAVASPAYRVAAFELGEEQPVHDPAAFQDLVGAYKSVRAAIDSLWPLPSSRPLLLGPCTGMVENSPPYAWDTGFLAALLPPPGGTPVLDGFVMHSYNDDGGNGWTQPGFLNETAVQVSGLRGLLDGYSPALPLWCGECGPHNGGGIANVTDRALSSFWYADALMALPHLGALEFGRQSLAGGNYGLLQNDDFTPNPDYFVAYAYAQLVGRPVLNSTTKGGVSVHAGMGAEEDVQDLHVYAQCAASGGGAVVLVWINISPVHTFNISLTYSGGSGSSGPTGSRAEYHLAPTGGDLLSPSLSLNGVALAVNGNDAPALQPLAERGDAAAPLSAAPYTLGFAVYEDAGAPACA